MNDNAEEMFGEPGGRIPPNGRVPYASGRATPSWVPIAVVLGVILLGVIAAFFFTSAG